MEKKRRTPNGVINWATLVRECLFVDNTSYIRKLEDAGYNWFDLSNEEESKA